VGSYSLFCGLSGLEIGEQALPPIRGVYGDYGYLDVEETPEFCAAWQVPAGRGWSVLDHHPDMMPMWIAGPVFDHLAQLPRVDGGLVQGDLDQHMADVEPALAQNIKMARSTASVLADRADDPEVADLLKLKDFLFTAGRHALSTDILPAVGADAVRMFDAGLGTDLLLQGYARAVQLHIGSLELRKPLYPANGSYGPQHGGGLAMVSFCTKVLELATERAKEDVAFTEGYSGD
jgi:hypothetical protein